MTDKMREAFERRIVNGSLGCERSIQRSGKGYFYTKVNDAWIAWQDAHKEGRKDGLQEAAKLCWEISEYYATCAEDGQVDEYQCSDIAHGAERCVQAIENLQEQDNG